jgi:ParB-like chromosome segregation protein Spo0J
MHTLIPLEVTNETVIISIEKLIINELSLKVYSTPSNYEEIRNNIDKTGIIQPILINRNYKVISGNLRLKIARDLNFDVVTVLVQDISDDEIDSMFLSSNFQREKSLLDKY